MKQLTEILATIEASYNIRILYACETGSRAWGFPSPDSDYDVRFIYMNEPNWYLALNEQKDSIEFMDGDWDITGWDLRKTLLLLKKSNAALVERFQSPIVYKNEATLKEDFNALIRQHYNPIAVFYHYHSLSTNFWSDIKNAQEIKLKSLMYIVRSLLCCVWALKDAEVLPMEIKPLLKYAPQNIQLKIGKLIMLKAGKNESYMHPMDSGMQEWIEATMKVLEVEKANVSVQNGDIQNLNDFFLKMWYGSNNGR